MIKFEDSIYFTCEIMVCFPIAKSSHTSSSHDISYTVHTCAYVHTHTVHAHTHTHVHKRMHTHTHTHVHKNVCMHTQHTHTHMQDAHKRY